MAIVRTAAVANAGTIPATGPTDRVVILGAGQRGLCCVIAARAAGARQIVITGLSRDARKLALARELGADVTIDVADGNSDFDTLYYLRQNSDVVHSGVSALVRPSARA